MQTNQRIGWDGPFYVIALIVEHLHESLALTSIWVCLFSRSAFEKHNQGKSPQTFAHLKNFSWMVSAMFDHYTMIHYCDCRINKPFTCSRCVICVPCSVHLISTYYARKGSIMLARKMTSAQILIKESKPIFLIEIEQIPFGAKMHLPSSSNKLVYIK